jgi:phage repressor protein C with HTH and peptisase S24 domain
VDVLMRLWQAQLGFDINYLITGEHTPDPEAALLENWVMVNRYDVAASAGNGSHVEDEQVISRLPINRKLVQELGADPNHLALIGVQGRSMEPLLKDKDVALLDTRKMGVTKDVWAFESEDGLMVKQIEPTKLGIRVVSLNPDFTTKIYSHNDSNALRFIGRVIWRCGRV